MTKINERPLSYGEEQEKSRKLSKSKGTKDFSTHGYIEKRKNSKHGSIRITKLPKHLRGYSYGKVIKKLQNLN